MSYVKSHDQLMRDPVYKLIGSLIRRRRDKLGMKQDALAKLLAISRGSLANIETGRQSILVHQLYKFAEALQLSPFDLLPTVDKGPSLDDWVEKLPAGLKPQQQQQIARLLSDTHPESTAERKEENVKKSRH